MFINHSYILNLTIKEKKWVMAAAENFYAADLLPQHHIFERTIKGYNKKKNTQKNC